MVSCRPSMAIRHYASLSYPLIRTCFIRVVGLQHKKATSERRDWLICKLSVLKKHWWQGAVRLVRRLTPACILLTRCLHCRVAVFINKRRPERFLLIFVTQCYNQCMLACSLHLPLNGKVESSQSFKKYEKCKQVLRHWELWRAKWCNLQFRDPIGSSWLYQQQILKSGTYNEAWNFEIICQG